MFWKLYNGFFILLTKIWLIWFITTITVFDFIYKKTIYNDKNTRVHFYYKFIVLYLSILLGSSSVFFLFALRPGYEGNISIFAPAAKYVARLLEIPVTIRNRENLAIDSAAIVTVNHQSMLDFLVSLNLWDIPKKFIVLGKSELKYVPLYGPPGLLAGVQFINRNKSETARAQLMKIGQEIKKKKVKLLVYPEGTRNYNQEEFLPFKKGAFHSAVAAQIPIIPIVISPYYFLDYKTKTFKSGRIIIQILEPVSTEGLTQADVSALVQKVRDSMSNSYKELTKEVLGAESEQESVDLGLTQKML